MKRRQLLGLSGLTLTVPFGGCASIGVPRNGPTRTTDGPGGETEEESAFTVTKMAEMSVEKRTDGFTDRYSGQKPLTEVVVGEKPKNADNPHGVEIYNDYESSVEISLTVNTESNPRTPVFEGEGTISTDVYIAIAIWRPATYTNRLEVSGEDVSLQKTFDLPQSAWDTRASEEKGLSPEHNVHIQKDEIEVKFVGEER